jgi:ribonucleotide reductase alpha subunit
MRVIKRTGDIEDVSFDKVLTRLKLLSKDIPSVDVYDIAQKVCSRIFDKVKTCELDELAAHICSSLIAENPDYGVLASRIIISNHHKKTTPSFSECISMLFAARLVHQEIYDIVQANKEKLNSYIDYNRDYTFDYFGFKTLENSYLMRIDGQVIERPQHMLMRVSLGIHKDDFKDALATYDYMSQKYFTHATPTLFNSGTNMPQLSSCFLCHMNDDSIDGIFQSLKECALISKCAGGIGIHTHNVRGKGSKINGTNGISDGILPMLRVFNNTARYCNQAGRRKGSIAVYLEPWHSDVFDFLDMKKPHGHEEERARDLFYALWIPDLFMERVKANSTWSLMCPHMCPGLSDVWGQEFVDLYTKYESENKYIKQVNAQDLWFKILESQIETGTPYLLYKDAANSKSNQKNLGTIKSSNLCVDPDTEILTDVGYFKIKDLKNQKVKVWNGEQFSETTVYQTGASIPLLEIHFDNGSVLKCTRHHKFYINDYFEPLEAKDLEVGMMLEEFRLPDDKTKKTVHVTAVYDKGYFNDTYCFNEPLRHRGVFNGIVTGNCTEIIEYTSPDEIAVCNLASLCLPTFVKDGQFDFEELHHVTKVVTKNLNKVIDINYYPLDKARTSNLRHRPIGIGVQGLADTFIKLKYAFDSKEASVLNEMIFETIYHAALETSMEISKKRHEIRSAKTECKDYLNLNEYEVPDGHRYLGAYSTFEGSPASQGILQFDMWNSAPITNRYDWDSLKQNIIQWGLRNSLLLAPMPTASTSQIMGFNEAFEPFTSNIYKRKTLAGEFILVNKYLVKDLLDLGLWTKEIRDEIIANDGSVQTIKAIPDDIKAIYKIVWEIKQKTLIDMAADRGKYICQSQSMNLFIEDPDFKKLSSMHFYAWQKGLKTGIYYLRTKTKAKTQKFTLDPVQKEKKVVCTEEVCTICSA